MVITLNCPGTCQPATDTWCSSINQLSGLPALQHDVMAAHWENNPKHIEGYGIY